MAQNYAGDVSVAETWKALQENPRAVLLDVRTLPELQFVGLPNLHSLGKDTQCVAWQIYPHMEVNPHFVEAVKGLGIDEEDPVYLLCRSGQRSASAAMALTQHGFKKCYNVEGGFEGPLDENRHRGAVAGWKAAGLPWHQN